MKVKRFRNQYQVFAENFSMKLAGLMRISAKITKNLIQIQRHLKAWNQIKQCCSSRHFEEEKAIIDTFNSIRQQPKTNDEKQVLLVSKQDSTRPRLQDYRIHQSVKYSLASV